MIETEKIYNESNLETCKRMPDGFLDLTVTSPPYDNLRSYNGFEWDFEKLAQELYRVTKPGGVVVWVVGDETVNGSETGTSFKQALYFKEVGFNLHDTMIYEKTGCSMPSPNRYLSAFEYMFVLSKGAPSISNLIADRPNRFPDRWGGGRKVRDKTGSFSYRAKYEPKLIGRRFNIWRYNNGGQGYGSVDDVSWHPASFPERLAKDHILSWSNEGDIVYDPFGGSMTTAKAAHLLKRRWIMSEISQEYCELGAKRLAPYLAQETLF